MTNHMKLHKLAEHMRSLDSNSGEAKLLFAISEEMNDLKNALDFYSKGPDESYEEWDARMKADSGAHAEEIIIKCEQEAA